MISQRDWNTPKDSEINEFLQRKLNYVRMIAKTIARTGMYQISAPAIGVDDLVQAGMIGLWRSIQSYNKESGASFKSYAYIKIRGYMLDEIRRYYPFYRRDIEGAGFIGFVSIEEGKFACSGEIEKAEAISVLERIEEKMGILEKQERVCFLSRMKGETNVEISSRFGVSDSRVSQIVLEARKKVTSGLSLS